MATDFSRHVLGVGPNGELPPHVFDQLEIPDANERAAMQAILDDYQAGQDATDTGVASVVTAGAQTQQALAGFIEPVKQAALAGFERPTFSTPVATTTLPVGVLADGRLYGAQGNVLRVSDNAGVSWATIRDLGANGGEIIRIMDTSGGEVLIVRAQALYRTAGWASDPASATVTMTLQRPGSTSFYPWGVDTNPATGVAVATTYIGSPPYNDGRYVWRSTDGGATWAVIYDLADVIAAEVGGTLADCHMHFAALDPWADDRIWIAWHGSTPGSGRIYWSDDDGTTWDRLPTDHHPTVAVAVKGGMVFGSDDLPQGVYVTPRTTDPAHMVYQFAYRWEANADGQVGWGHWGTRTPDGERAFIAFIADVNDPPIVVQSDGRSASLMLDAPASGITIRTDGYRGIHYVNGELVAMHRSNGATTPTYTLERAPLLPGRVPTISPTTDPGVVLGGASGGTRAVAVGNTSKATAAQTVAVGAEAHAAFIQSVAVGDSTETTGSASVAAGFDASAGSRSSAIGKGATAPGPDAIALGDMAVATGQYVIAIGSAASAPASYGIAIGNGVVGGHSAVTIGAGAKGKHSSVSVGRNSDSKADLSTVVGHSAVGGGAYSTVLGQGASITGTTQRATALGQGAVVGEMHTSSTALGSQVTTTAAQQTAIGARHMEMLTITAPAAPAAGAARLFTRNLAGKQELCVRFPDASIHVLAVEP